jgi:hypothetical protein
VGGERDLGLRPRLVCGAPSGLGGKKQIPFGNDKQKRGNGKCLTRRFWTAGAQSRMAARGGMAAGGMTAREDGGGTNTGILRCAQNDKEQYGTADSLRE